MPNQRFRLNETLDCYSLQSVDLPYSVKSIGKSAFYGCEHLENVWSLGSIEIIEPYTFEGCNLKYIHLPSTLKKIGDEAFKENTELISIDLPDSVEELGNSCFAYCYKFERINLGESVHSIGDFCFFKTSIKEIRLPSSLKYMGTRPFDSIENIITKSNSLFVSKAGMLINKELKKLECYFGNDTTLELKDIKSISPLAFYKSKVENISIPNYIKVIPEYAFYHANKIRSISLPSQLERIDTAAFCDCSSLQKIIIPENVKEIKSSSFGRCLSLKSIQFKGAKTKASESIILDKCYDGFPSIYRSHNELMGCTVEDKIDYEVDIESLEVIMIIVPQLAKDNYKFNPVYSSWYDPMKRRFQIIESNEDCEYLDD